MSDLRIATRGSKLALTQAEWVSRRIAGRFPGIEIELVVVSTVGDIDRTSPVAELSELGAFVRAVQHAVLRGDADMAVHSCKDLPTSGPDDLAQWFPERAAVWDVLCGATVESLPAGARIGSGSPRRRAQMNVLRPDVEVVDIRGNVETRLAAVGNGLDAVILAEAGLTRLGRQGRIDHRFSIDEMVPAPAQAALCIETVEGSTSGDLAESIQDTATRVLVEAERLLLAETGAGCRSALGALASPAADGIEMVGFVSDERGPRRSSVSADSPGGAVSALREDLLL